MKNCCLYNVNKNIKNLLLAEKELKMNLTEREIIKKNIKVRN